MKSPAKGGTEAIPSTGSAKMELSVEAIASDKVAGKGNSSAEEAAKVADGAGDGTTDGIQIKESGVVGRQGGSIFEASLSSS